MKKIFRKYRNAVIKYLLEILVIITGVLGAFGLNNWKGDQNKLDLEREVLEQIQEDLEITLVDLKNDIIIHRKALAGHENINAFLNSEKEYNDSLIFDFYWIKQEEYIFPSLTGYDNLNSFGIDILSNDTIQAYISAIYNHDYLRLSKGSTLYPDISDYLDDYYRQNFRVNEDTTLNYELILSDEFVVQYPRVLQVDDMEFTQFIGYHPIDINKLKNDSTFKYLLSESLKYRLYKFRVYKNCINHIEEAIRLIERQLN